MTVKVIGEGMKGIHINEVTIDRAEKLDCTVGSLSPWQYIKIAVAHLKLLFFKK
jgi:hypothetical protein